MLPVTPEPPHLTFGRNQAMRSWSSVAAKAVCNFTLPAGERRLLAELLRGAFRAGWKAARQDAGLLDQPRQATSARPLCEVCGWILRPDDQPDDRPICTSCHRYLTLPPEPKRCSPATHEAP